jgi:hypothetical protein
MPGGGPLPSSFRSCPSVAPLTTTSVILLDPPVGSFGEAPSSCVLLRLIRPRRVTPLDGILQAPCAHAALRVPRSICSLYCLEEKGRGNLLFPSVPEEESRQWERACTSAVTPSTSATLLPPIQLSAQPGLRLLATRPAYLPDLLYLI